MARDFISKKKRGTLEKLDMISNLPQEVTDEILMRMPIKDAVKTSVLSTKWCYRWTTIPELVFDDHLMKQGQDDENMVKVVNNVLLLHNAMISKFELKNVIATGCSDINRWIVVLSRSKMLYHLVLAFNTENSSYKLPACLFSCETLRTLKLEACILKLPSQYKGFSHLTELELNHVNLASGAFETLVAKIPLLKKLKVIYCQSLTRINVHAPNLEVFQMNGLYESINFQNTTNLIDIHLWLPKVTCWVDQVHGGVKELQAVSINFPNTESFPIDDAPEGWHKTYNHLKCAFFLLSIEDSSQVLAVLSLCKISPCLEKLELFTYVGQSVQLHEEHFWDKRLHTEDVFHHLKTVKLNGFMGVQHELGLIQFILLNAMVLETFIIYWGYVNPALTYHKKLLVVQDMMQFQRASTKAKVMFKN